MSYLPAVDISVYDIINHKLTILFSWYFIDRGNNVFRLSVIEIAIFASLIVIVAWLTVLSFKQRSFAFIKKSIQQTLSESDDSATALAKLVAQIDMLNKRQQDLADQLSRLEQNLHQKAGAIGLVRYDAFPEAGGNLSFSVAFLNDEGSGIVVSSINGRQEGRVYAKFIHNHHSNQPLSLEEEQAINKASEKLMGAKI